MTSDDQIQANQTNSQLSTGPVSEEGKAISSLNALKHGLFAREAVLSGESEDKLIELGKNLRKDLKPATELERVLVDTIATVIWRLRRAVAAEKASMELELSDSGISFDRTDQEKNWRKYKDMVASSSVERISKYENSLLKNFYQALHELQRLQAARTGGTVSAPSAIDISINRE
jgi:hypothetical protein